MFGFRFRIGSKPRLIGRWLCIGVCAIAAWPSAGDVPILDHPSPNPHKERLEEAGLDTDQASLVKLATDEGAALEDRENALGTLGCQSDGLRRMYSQLIDSDADQLSYYAAKCLAYADVVAGIEKLRELTRSEIGKVRVNSAAALTYIEDLKWIDVLISESRSTVFFTKWVAMLTLQDVLRTAVESGSDEYRDKILDRYQEIVVKDTDRWARKLAIYLLATSFAAGDERIETILKSLIPRLSDDPELQEKARNDLRLYVDSSPGVERSDKTEGG